MKIVLRYLILITCLVSQGCAVVREEFYKPAGEKGDAVARGCGSSAKRKFEFDIQDLDYLVSTHQGVLFLTLIFQEGVDVRLVDTKVYVSVDGTAFQQPEITQFHNVIQVPEDMKIPEGSRRQCAIIGIFGCKPYKTIYLHAEFDDTNNPSGSQPKEITVIAPAVSINGAVFKPEKIHFRAVSELVVSPLNC